MHPGAEGGLAPELGEVLVGGEEGVLGDLRRVRLGPRHPQRQAVDLVLVALHQGLEGGHVPLLGALEQGIPVSRGPVASAALRHGSMPIHETFSGGGARQAPARRFAAKSGWEHG